MKGFINNTMRTMSTGAPPSGMKTKYAARARHNAIDGSAGPTRR
ncbi:MAG TPA: hypothetical protein VEK79_23765 [Thermoanaerobaculia bacterium]|nr:hypothetical protein [Thermoanaerobaculia bacterium]